MKLEELNIYQTKISFYFKTFSDNRDTGILATNGMFFWLDQIVEDAGVNVLILRPVNNKQDPFLNETYIEVFETDADDALAYAGKMEMAHE